MSNRRFEYTSDKQITSQKADEINVFLWVAFAQNSDGVCVLEKQTAFSPTQTFYTIERLVDEIVELDLNTSNIYAIFRGSNVFVERLSLNNPLSATNHEFYPPGVIEAPVDLTVDNSDVFILTPGSLSGENAKVLRYNTSLNFVEEIDLSKTGLTVTDASSITIDSNGDIRVLTNTDPSTIIRVYELSGGGWDFSEYII
jgi:hypothetical protein